MSGFLHSASREKSTQYLEKETCVSTQTLQLQAAIDRAGQRGGGTVRVTPGIWEITTLFLRSGVRLHLEAGAILQAAHSLELYPPIALKRNSTKSSLFHLIYAEDCSDIAITGDGMIDGQDTVFLVPCEREEERPYGIFDFILPAKRPSPLVLFVRCSLLKVEDITIRRAPGWTLHCEDCDDVRIRHIRVRNHLQAPNTDGIVVTDSRDVHISGCDLICGDDAIVIKSSHPEKICERVIVTDCIAESNCAAFGLGAEVAGVIRDVVFSNCVARAALRILQIQLWQAGLVENIVFSNIVGRTFPSPRIFCERPIYIDIQQYKRPDAALGRVRNVYFSNIVCTTRGRILMTAQDGAVLENITLRDVHLDVPEIEDPQEVVPKARSLQLSNFSPEARAARSAVVCDNMRALRLEGVTVRWPTQASVPMHAIWCRNVSEVVLNSPQLEASHPSLAKFSLLNSRLGS